ncbi:hypothetical protein QYF61_003527 [Mycteria americana]|uniref:SRCR domain-containing protein n=1 Tax=Mycteria americana TaxID=33587 RepID=A0AAN7S3J2_MYCAM|nr:hypothetical protein QYF61_003527 [Mycteria americana]
MATQSGEDPAAPQMSRDPQPRRRPCDGDCPAPRRGQHVVVAAWVWRALPGAYGRLPPEGLEPRSQRKPSTCCARAALGIFLLLLTAGQGLLAYKVFKMQREILKFQEQNTEGILESSFGSKLLLERNSTNQHMEHEENWRRSLEEEITIIKSSNANLMMMVNNITLVAGTAPSLRAGYTVGRPGSPAPLAKLGQKPSPDEQITRARLVFLSGLLDTKEILVHQGYRDHQGQRETEESKSKCLHGLQGPKGSKGEPGPAGLNGEPGVRGEKGEMGLAAGISWIAATQWSHMGCTQRGKAEGRTAKESRMVSKDRKEKRARRETLGPVDPQVLRDSRESQDCQVSMVAQGSLDILGRKESQVQTGNVDLWEFLALKANLVRKGRKGTTGSVVVQECQALQDSEVKRETKEQQVFQGKREQRETRARQVNPCFPGMKGSKGEKGEGTGLFYFFSHLLSRTKAICDQDQGLWRWEHSSGLGGHCFCLSVCFFPQAHMTSRVIFFSSELSGNLNAFIRIAEGGRKGRVEIFHEGSWGTICDDDWGTQDATVVCRMLGYNRAVSAFTATAGSGQIWLDNVNCSGNERSIFECPKLAWGVNNCSHSEDAGVECI